MDKPRPFHILILGGSGRTGQLVTAEALRRGHKVTALVRNLDVVSARPGLTLVEGSPLSKTDVEKAVAAIPSADQVVVISTLAQTRTSGNPWAATTSPRRLMVDAIAHTIAIVQSSPSRIQKLVVMSMQGAGDSFASLNFLMRLIMRWSNMSQTLEDHNLVDEKIRGSRINYVLPRAAMLKGEEAAKVMFLGDAGERAGLMPSISRKSVAVFLLDAAESDSWDRSTPVISN